LATRTAYDATASSVLTATNLDKHAGGWIGYVQVTANQTGITTIVDITSLTLTVTALANRYHRTTLYLPGVQSTVTTDAVTASLTDGSNVQVQQASVVTGAVGTTAIVTAVETGFSGSSTRKGRIARASGSGSVTMGCLSTAPAWLLIEDLGSV
jgi:hypothetical protein